MQLSIIIPAYNAQDYIEFCLNSCLKQDLELSDYEIIVINDGSTDDTLKKISSFTKKHPNIHLKTQLNKGHGAARNIGAALSKGKFIYFLDADDYLAKNTLGTVLKLQDEFSLDMIIFSSRNVRDDSHTNSKHSNSKIKIKKTTNGIEFLGSHDYSAEVWRYMINKEFYNQSELSFYDKKFVQDSYFTPTLISKAERISYIDYDVHRYRNSHNSITRNTSAEHFITHFNDMCFAVHQLYQLKKKLISKGVNDHETLHRLNIKQQHYVFIIISRFIRSNLKIEFLKKILDDFKNIEAFPLDKFLSNKKRKSKVYQLLTFIYNRNYLLYPSIKVFRLINSLKL